MTKDAKTNIGICKICLLRIVFIFVFVHQKNYRYTLHREAWLQGEDDVHRAPKIDYLDYPRYY